MIGQTLGHYRIVERVGEGGMGVVYRAHDIHLERDVALKVLLAGTVGDTDARQRFRHEARALSRLNHPNIATVHDFDAQDGIDFLVMEYLPGGSLRDRLARGPLPEGEALELGAQVADGLAAAHAAGVVHRDLKPANVQVLPDGRVKVVDFGVAALLRQASAGADASTRAATVVQEAAGTLPYMAPEQVRAEACDARTDVWALGVLLYEATTGRRPFAATATTALVEEILRQAPAPPRQLRPDVSERLEDLLLKCLEKDADSRYQSARELATDLRRLQAGGDISSRRNALSGRTASRRVESLAVLPLENLSGDPRQEYFADGMTESLITDLGRLTGLKRVIARGSVMRYKGTTKSPAEIARELNVDALVTGAVVRSGDRVRVTAQLISPEGGNQLWAEQYERDLTDVLRLQNEVTRAIAGEIRVTLGARDQARLASAGSVSPEAFDAYLMGRFHWYRMSPDGLDKAVEYFQLALNADPDYARAHAGLGFVWTIRAHTGLIPAAHGYERGRAAALKALEVDNSLAEAHDLLAGVLTWYEWEWAAGESEYRRAIELNASYADVRCFYAFFLHAMGRQQEARAQIERALELDPYNTLFHHGLAFFLLSDRRPDEALVHLERAATLQPGSLFVHADRWCAFDQKGEFEKARAEAREYFALLGAREVAQTLERGEGQRGYRAAMRRAAEVLAARSIRASVSQVDVAKLYALAGENDRAMDWLERACQVRASRLPYLNVLREFDGLRAHPRFKSLLRRMKFPL